MVSLNIRFGQGLVFLRLRLFSGMFGTMPRLKMAQAGRKQEAVVDVGRSHWERDENVSMVLYDGHDLLARMALVSGVSDSVAAFLRYRVRAEIGRAHV